MESEKLFSIITISVISVMLGMVILFFLVKFLKECLIPIWRERVKERRHRKKSEEPEVPVKDIKKPKDDSKSKYDEICGIIAKINNVTRNWYGITFTCANHASSDSRDGFPDLIDLDGRSTLVVFAMAYDPASGSFLDGGEFHRETFKIFPNKSKRPFADLADDVISWLRRFRDYDFPYGCGNILRSQDPLLTELFIKDRKSFLREWAQKVFENDFNRQFGKQTTQNNLQL